MGFWECRKRDLSNDRGIPFSNRTKPPQQAGGRRGPNPHSVAAMAKVAFTRALAGMGNLPKQAGDAVSTETVAALGEVDLSVVNLTDEIQAVRMHQLAISLRPLPGSTGRPMLTASRWEVRKAIMSLCCTPPTMFEVIFL